MRARTIISTVLGCVLLAGALAYSLHSQPQEAPSQPPRATLVRVEAATESVASHTAYFSAITRPKHHAVLSFTIAAQMTSRPVDIGDKVEAGQVLASLDVGQFDNAENSAKAAVDELTVRLAQARRDDIRYEQLEKSKAVSASTAEKYSSAHLQLQAALAGAQSRLAEARRQRNEAELRAPFSGVIDKVFLEPGEWAQPGQPVLEVIGTKETELEVEVPETIIGHLSEGQRVDIRLPFAGNLRVHGTIEHLAKATMSSGHLFPVLIVISPNPKLIPGMTAELVVTIESHQALLVPVAAVVNPGGSRPSLFVLQDDRVREVFVHLVQFLGDKVMVTGKLSAGDRVVVSGQTTLIDGKHVEVGS